MKERISGGGENVRKTKNDSERTSVLPDGAKKCRLRIGKFTFDSVDIAASVVFILLFSYLLYAVRYTFMPDDSYWITLGQRLAHGDRLLVDEWQAAQFFSFLMVLPYVLYTSVVKSADGILLFVRYLHVLLDMALYVFLYKRFRIYKLWGLAAVFCFCAFFPGLLLTPSYYAFSLKGFAVVCSMLCLSEKDLSPAALIASGCVLSVSVLCEPLCAIIYVIYAALVFVRYRRIRKGKGFLEEYAFAVNRRTFLWLSTGVAFCAGLFILYIVCKSGIGNIVRALPGLLSDPEYEFTANQEGSIFTVNKLVQAVQFYGVWQCAAGAAILLVAFYYRVFITKKNKNDPAECGRWKTVILAVASVTLMLAFVYGAVHVFGSRNSLSFLLAHNAPSILFGLICYLLCDKKNKRLFVFWFVGLVVSTAVDMASDVMFGMGGILSQFGTVIFFGDLLREIREITDQKNVRKTVKGKRRHRRIRRHRFRTDRRRHALRVLGGVIVFCFVGWELLHLFCMGPYPYFEKTFMRQGTQMRQTAVITDGPLKGMRTTMIQKQHYDDTLADLDLIRENSAEPVLIAGMCPFAYLYLDLPFGTYSAWWDDSEWRTVQKNFSRQLMYWKLHPDKLPEYVYVPEYGGLMYAVDPIPQERLELFTSGFRCEAVKGRAGYYFIRPKPDLAAAS